MAGEGGELVRRGDEGQAGQRRQFCSNRLTKTMRRIQPGADRGAALSQFTHGRQCSADCAFGVIQLRDKPGKLLAKGDRCRVHHVRTTGLHQFHVPRGQFCETTG
ncbi:hypothetical protein D3C81_1614410 [compost metagenome]